MRVLAIDCATEACSAALFDGDRLIAGAFEIIGRGHAERLVPMIAELPNRGRAERIVVSLGPGSFTGTRIGLAAARALGLAWQVEVLGYPTLALVAAQGRGGGEVPIAACMTGGHGEWFVQSFAADGLPLDTATSLQPEEAAVRVTCPVVAGSQAEALVAVRGTGEARSLLPDARALASLPPALLTGVLAPIYGRAPDARLSA